MSGQQFGDPEPAPEPDSKSTPEPEPVKPAARPRRPKKK
jgi:hypothetical protein